MDGTAASKRLVVGLGNPGERYAPTRHNVGFLVVEEVARRFGVDLRPGECNAHLARARPAAAGGPDGPEVLLAAPQTYMNRSGYAARCLAERHGFEADEMLIVYDEVHLPLGKLRLRPGGSPAGHRGLESVIENLGTDLVPRLRLGVAGEDGPPAGDALVDFVLAPFADGERETVAEMVRRAASACEVWAREGTEAAMQAFNG